VNEHGALVFLIALALTLGVARVTSLVGRDLLGAPLVAGGVLSGVVLGKTVLGRIAPAAYGWLFEDGAASTMLAGYALIGAILLLVVAGLEVDLSVLRRRGRDALPLIVLGVAVPLASGILLGLWLPTTDPTATDGHLYFAALLGVALTVSALPAIAKTLADLGLFKTDLGLLVMAAATVGDIVGWLAFSILLGARRQADTTQLALLAVGSIVFAGGCVLVGRRVLDWLLTRLQLDPETAPSRTMWLVLVIALSAAGLTQAIGIDAVLGGFFVGVALGDTPRLRVRTRLTVREFVLNVFAPVFLASAALHVDFAASFDPWLSLLVLVVATLAKVLGSSVGARLSGLRWREAAAVGFALNARGSLEMILAVSALRAGLIGEPLFVALVTMTLVTSLASGPVMKRLLYRVKAEEDVVGLLRSGAFVARLEATLPMVAIEELVHALGDSLGPLAEKARICVIERELVASTGLGDEIAIPHAAVPGLARPLLALGRAPHGIDFDSADGKPAKIIFLILVPPKAYEEEVHILASIARAVFDGRARDELLAATTLEDVTRVLGESASRTVKASKGGAAARAAGPAGPAA
jgi:Kef-type K+ transport system membrane component KefB/mannitol/fructose-specific phosphotransferase system IIA component (Ntr-type)